MSAVVILGMHRSGTSCLAGMLAAGGVASAGDAICNWDNVRGHHEMLDVVRLNEAVLAHSGGHWLAAPREVRWTDAHAVERDRLLRASIDGRPALLKDPRTLLVLPFWRASPVGFRAIGIVRHPLAVARSLEAWREMPLADGIALWTVHNRALADDRARHGTIVIDFEQPKSAVVAAVRAVFPAADADTYEEHLVHHGGDDAPGLDEALALYRALGGGTAARRAFPHAELDAFKRALTGGANALAHARAALAAVDDVGAVLVPLVIALVRHRAYADALTLVDERASEGALAELLRGKVLLAAGDAAAAVRHLEVACATRQSFYQARHLLPQALRKAGRHADARTALRAVATDALYPHNPLATLAEWSWLDGDPDRALREIEEAIAAAPMHRRGRLRTRCAEWLLARGNASAAREHLQRAIDEDPSYTRSREVLSRL